MASLLEKFEGTLASGNWVTYTKSGSLTTTDGYATQTGATAPPSTDRRGVAFQDTVEPEEEKQDLSITFSTAEEGSTLDGVLLGALGSQNTTYGDATPGVWARFLYMADGQRRLEVWENWDGTGFDNGTRLAFVDVVLPGGVEASGYESLLYEKGAVAVIQKLNLLVEPEDAGLRIKAWLNNKDPDHPTLSVLSRSDAGTPVGSDEGQWWWGIWQDSVSDGSVAITSFEAEDVAAATAPTKDFTKLGNFPTLAELKQLVLDEYANSQNIDTVPVTSLTNAINWGMRRVLNKLGDTAWWIKARETFNLAFTAARTATMPAYVKRIVDARRASDGNSVSWRQDGFDNAGNVLLWSPCDEELEIEYVIRYEEAHEDSDCVPIPREHVEVMVLSASEILARRDNNPNYQLRLRESLQLAFGDLQRDANRHLDMKHTRMRPRFRYGRDSYPHWIPWAY